MSNPNPHVRPELCDPHSQANQFSKWRRVVRELRFISEMYSRSLEIFLQDFDVARVDFQEWCPACIAARARPDAHKTDVHKTVDKSITSLSFDLSYTGKEFDPTGKPWLIDVEEGWKEKLIVLNAHDAHTGAVLAIPLQKKGHTKYVARELSRFAMSLGIGELQVYCDNEPTLLQVLAACIDSACIDRLGLQSYNLYK